MRTVNRYMLGAALDPIGSQEWEEALSALNGEDEAAVRQVIRDAVEPWVLRFDARSRETVKDTLRYYLTRDAPTGNTGRDVFADLFNAQLPPFQPPSDIRRLYTWLWDELFGPEPPAEIADAEYLIDEDYEAPNGIRLSPG